MTPQNRVRGGGGAVLVCSKGKAFHSGVAVKATNDPKLTNVERYLRGGGEGGGQEAGSVTRGTVSCIACLGVAVICVEVKCQSKSPFDSACRRRRRLRSKGRRESGRCRREKTS